MPQVVNRAAPPPGLKSNISQLPGALVLHRLLKNFRYWAFPRSQTVGGIKRASMTVEEAVDYTFSIYQKIDGLVRENRGWENKDVLEVGPGDSLGTGVWCLGAGARSYTAIDRFAVDLDREFESKVMSAILLHPGFSDAKNFSEQVSPVTDFLQDSQAFQYKNNVPIEEGPEVLGHSCFDVIFSNAVLEHVSSVEETLKAMSVMLADGGIMFHEVDLRSHQTFEKHPLQFLEYPTWLWRLMSSHNGEPNRMRMSGYLKILQGLGLEVLATGVTHVFEEGSTARIQKSLAPEFRQMPFEGLLPAVFWFTCRKTRK